MHHQYLTIWDIVLTPIYLLVLILIARRQRNKRYPVGSPLRKYFLPGLYVKFFGVIFIALIYQFYYGSGDTFAYFEHIQVINSSLFDSVNTWFKLLLGKSSDDDPQLYKYISQLRFYSDHSAYIVSVIGAVVGLFGFTTYIPIALIFAYLSYTGIWAMYRTFANIYPHLIKPLAVAFLFIPSTFIWGSAIFKDTICMFGLGWMVYASFRIFINRDFSLKNLLLLSLSFYLIAIVKLYILLSFMPALSLWILLRYSHKIRSAAMRLLARLLFVGITVLGFVFFANSFAKEMDRYSLDKIVQTASGTRNWIAYATDEEGSGYTLGEFDNTITGMLSKFPQAVVVTLYRPFLWEARKVIVMLSSLEALAFLFFTLKVIFTRRKNLFKIGKDPNLIFCLIFSIIFAFSVGITSYNFGALSRYKIPCLPFFAASLVILLYKNVKPEKELSPKKPGYSKKLELA
jgi:hypothetical protein